MEIGATDASTIKANGWRQGSVHPARLVERLTKDGAVAQRYVRAAFPDEFNERTREALKRLHKAFKKHGHLMTAVYVTVIDDELEDGQDYNVDLCATMRAEDYDDESRRVTVQDLVNRLEAELGRCSGIHVSTSDLRSERDFSIDDVRLMKRLDFDDLSFRENSVDNLPRTL